MIQMDKRWKPNILSALQKKIQNNDSSYIGLLSLAYCGNFSLFYNSFYILFSPKGNPQINMNICIYSNTFYTKPSDCLNKRGPYILLPQFPNTQEGGKQSISTQKSIRKYEKETREKKGKRLYSHSQGHYSRPWSTSMVFMHVVCFGIKSLNIKKTTWIYKKHVFVYFVHFIYLNVFIYLFCAFKEKRQGRSCGGMDTRLILKLEFHQIITKSNSFLKIYYYVQMYICYKRPFHSNKSTSFDIS